MLVEADDPATAESIRSLLNDAGLAIRTADVTNSFTPDRYDHPDRLWCDADRAEYVTLS